MRTGLKRRERYPRLHLSGPPFGKAFAVEVIDLGIDRIVVLGPTVDADEEEQKRCAELLVREVLPAFAG
ncbi:MAG: hypothetical protein OXJ55_05695 [Caldilineaceae bacterium]|nr:hypothetical protein [Caldilineaceae bacterium]MDE0463795.1 hypothetical protein [Caldilineaceae bacterium]